MDPNQGSKDLKFAYSGMALIILALIVVSLVVLTRGPGPPWRNRAGDAA